MLAHPGFEVGGERGAARSGRGAVDVALDVEARVDAGDLLKGDRRDGAASAPCLAIAAMSASTKNLRGAWTR